MDVTTENPDEYAWMFHARCRGVSPAEFFPSDGTGVETAQRVCGTKIKINMAPRRPGDPPILVGSADRARTLLGWTPTRSALEVQIGDAWNWMLNNKA